MLMGRVAEWGVQMGCPRVIPEAIASVKKPKDVKSWLAKQKVRGIRCEKMVVAFNKP